MTTNNFASGPDGLEHLATTVDGIDFAIDPSDLGRLLVARTARGICAILLGDDAEKLREDLRGAFSRAVGRDRGEELADVHARVRAFVERRTLALDESLDVRGTGFQQRVWALIRTIPAGRTATYADLARTLGVPDGARAVAGACAANVLAVAIPCHRVVRGDGELSGYRWGIDRKREILRRERLP